MCDPDLLFLYLVVAVPGKVNNLRAFNNCLDPLNWLDALPDKYYTLGDNVYSLSKQMLIPFDTPELVAAVDHLREYYRTFNFYLL